MIFNISKENTTRTEADFAVCFLSGLKNAFYLALFILCSISFILWQIKPVDIRLGIFFIITIYIIHYMLSKYKKVWQEYTKGCDEL